MGIEKQPVGVRLDEETVKALRQICAKENRTISNLIETIVKTYLKELKEKTKD